MRNDDKDIGIFWFRPQLASPRAPQLKQVGAQISRPSGLLSMRQLEQLLRTHALHGGPGNPERTHLGVACVALRELGEEVRGEDVHLLVVHRGWLTPRTAAGRSSTLGGSTPAAVCRRPLLERFFVHVPGDGVVGARCGEGERCSYVTGLRY